MRRVALSLAGLALLVAAPLQDAGARKRGKSACQRLKAKHTDRSPNRRLVVAVRGDWDAGDVSACVLPRGKVRRAVRWDDGLGRASGALVGTRGLFVLVAEWWSDQYGGVSEVLRRVDVRTGRRTALTGYGCMLDYSRPACPDGTTFGEVVIAATGAGAVESTDFATGLTTLWSFDAAGKLAPLDEGPVDDLRLAGGELAWTRAGAERRAPLPD